MHRHVSVKSNYKYTSLKSNEPYGVIRIQCTKFNSQEARSHRAMYEGANHIDMDCMYTSGIEDASFSMRCVLCIVRGKLARLKTNLCARVIRSTESLCGQDTSMT